MRSPSPPVSGRATLLTALLVAVLTLLCAGRAAANAPILPGEYPDPSVIKFNGEYIASATSDRWEPVFPIVTSPDLKTWTQVGAVFDQAPTWAAGKRFWAPEFADIDGRLTVFYSGLRKTGGWCIGAASAAAPAGPWTDEGPVFCPPGGAIDPAYFEEADGTAYLLYKVKGIDGPIQAAPFDKHLLSVTGPGTSLVAPLPVVDGSVSEGPAVIKHANRYYLFFSTGGCCKPPCSYTEQLARSSSLLGPYERMDHPLLATDGNYTCPGHGTPVDGPDGNLYILHHGYGPDYPDDRRREGLLTKLKWTTNGWLDRDGTVGGAGPAGPDAVTDPAQTPTPPMYTDIFSGPGLDRAWQRPISTSPPSTDISGGRLALRCGPGQILARQIAKAPFDLTVTIKPGTTGTSTVGFRDSGGLLRGLQVRNGSVRPVRQSPSHLLFSGPAVPQPASRSIRVQLSARPGGQLFGTILTTAGPVDVPMGLAANGRKPVRLGLTCTGTAPGIFSSVQVTGGDWVTSNAVQPFAFGPQGVGTPITGLKH